ncbi:lycopene cyclase [Dokdonia sinensis]|uniref:Lycopene cyclase n=1 Tax=Dokdonia sinensis TaxID=2479847 RepID=A0A3M0GFM1_9FLAO|nr:lycopene cyclase [Dokdonia sinensis]
MQKHYDYIILGAGLSGYTMALRMARDAFFGNKSIAIIDADFNKGNDRTWCFWETEPDIFEEVVSYRWSKILVQNDTKATPIEIAPYLYKKIEGKDFYAFAKAELSQHSNITFIEAKVEDYQENGNEVKIQTSEGSLTAGKVLNSIYKPEILEQQNQKVVLQQHFVGWFIRTETPVFYPNVASYMDFNIPQNGNCRFMYVLPTSNKEALLEYTLFSKDLLPKAEYEEAIKSYLKNLGVSTYEITAREQGSIPMTTYDFTQHNTDNVLHIGTAGGWTKASTGYTFKHTVKKSKKLIEFLKSAKPFTVYSLKNRWTFYDAVLLEVLDKHNEKGAEIFTRMFKDGKANHIFRFLDEDSSYWDEFKVIWSAPKVIFIKAALRVLFRK